MADLSHVQLQDVRLDAGRSLALVIVPPVAPKGPARRQGVADVVHSVLARLTGLPRAAIRIGKSAQGRPFLAGVTGIAFSLSHSANYSLVALSRAGEIGCDIEDRFTDGEVSGLCLPLLHPSELAAMDRMAPHARQDALRRYWVRKEAVLKAAGSGFLGDPREVVTGLEERHARWTAHEGPPFILHNQQIDKGCIAAVASMDADCQWRLLGN